MKLRIAIALVLLALALGCVTGQSAQSPPSNIYNNGSAANGTGSGSGSGSNTTNITDMAHPENPANWSADNLANATNASTTSGTNGSINESSNPGALNCTANITTYYFYSESCPFCMQTTPFIDEVEQNFTGMLCIVRFETSRDRDNLRRFYELADQTGFPAALQGVPTIFINGTYITGVGNIKEQLVPAIQACLSQGCTGPAG